MIKYFDQVRAKHPLIHCITNYVTVNDCANLLLACGASPIMADDAAEAPEITAICQGTVLNIGTLNQWTIPAMFAAGKKAKELRHPVVLDPVGAGASTLRTATALRILDEVRPDILRCNMSELKMLMHTGSHSRGVDVSEPDRINENNFQNCIKYICGFSAEYHCVTAVSGAVDLIASPEGKVCVCRNGHPMMARITGSGCMLTVLAGAFAAASEGEYFESVCAAFAVMGIAGEYAYENMSEHDGNASYRNHLIDAVCNADCSKWERRVRCEMF